MSEKNIVFPEKIRIKLIDKSTSEELLIKDVALYIYLIATKKNDFHLGPYFSNSDGLWEISREWLEISAEGVIQSGLMDFRPYTECKQEVKLKIPSKEEIEKAIEARKMWGILGSEAKIYGDKEQLLNNLASSNNRLIEPTIQNVRFDGNQDTLEVNLLTINI